LSPKVIAPDEVEATIGVLNVNLRREIVDEKKPCSEKEHAFGESVGGILHFP
jgi:hypothetical protein